MAPQPMLSYPLPWCEPLQVAQHYHEQDIVLLFSSAATGYSGRYSYLACNKREEISASDFAALETALKKPSEPMQNRWFGYLGYGLKDCLENLPTDAPGWHDLPPLLMMRFGCIYLFDHVEKQLIAWSDTPTTPLSALSNIARALPKATLTHSNMSKAEYLSHAATIIDRVHAGDLYQANLTRKFAGKFSSMPDSLALFARMCEVTPAPYSAFIRHGKHSILSSSPEQFLMIDTKGNIRTRPIKGTAKRGATPQEDAELKQALQSSSKNRAENLMIVDLMRNDLSRHATPGSVQTAELFEVSTHATIHHLSSTVTANIAAGASTLDVIKGAFPPGSMTGAPKLTAMRLCSELEKLERGVYSGAIGWLDANGASELSVVIRTLIIHDTNFEFQVGGGIVADSTPYDELVETVNKSKGICLTLDIDSAALLTL
jgi:para-aminobenzoate synthetase component I